MGNADTIVGDVSCWEPWGLGAGCRGYEGCLKSSFGVGSMVQGRWRPPPGSNQRLGRSGGDEHMRMGRSRGQGLDFTIVKATLGLARSAQGKVVCATMPLVVLQALLLPLWMPTQFTTQLTTHPPQINSGLIAEAEAILDSVIVTSPRELGARVARGTARALRRNLAGEGWGGRAGRVVGFVHGVCVEGTGVRLEWVCGGGYGTALRRKSSMRAGGLSYLKVMGGA